MATYQEQTGREAALEEENARLRSNRSGMQDCIKLRENQIGELKSECAVLAERIDEMKDSAFADGNTIKHLKSKVGQMERDLTVKSAQAEAWRKEYEGSKAKVKLLEERITDMGSDMVADANTIKTLKEEREMMEKNVKYLRDENERLKREKEASSGPCGCQAYRDLEEKVGDLESEVNALDNPSRPTMPVIPKAVAIAIFREGVAHGVSSACDEIDNDAGITIEETGYTGDFEVSFNRWIDLSDHIDLDWMRDKVGDYDEASVIEASRPCVQTTSSSAVSTE